MKRVFRPYFWILLISAIYGVVFGVVSNLFFDRLVNAVWPPLAIMILFVCFLLPLLVIILVISEHKGTRVKNEKSILMMLISIVFFMVSVFGLEAIYEIGLTITAKDVDSYIFVIDDSASMENSDPTQVRVSSIEKLLADKDSSFQYAIYSFSNTYTQNRAMLPKNQGLSLPEMKADGGTAIYTTLEGILDDIETGKLMVTENTRMLFLSDGAATDTGLFSHSLRDTLRKYVSKGLIISTVGLGNSADSRTLKMIANTTGGAYIKADDVDQLTGAMVEASTQSVKRTLLSVRFFCRTEVLHAIMRIVFLLIIALIVQIIKIESYGKYYKPQLAVGSVCSITAALFVEFAIEHSMLGDNFCRVVFWILLSLIIIEEAIRLREYGNDGSGADDDSSEQTEKDTSGLSETDWNLENEMKHLN